MIISTLLYVVGGVLKVILSILSIPVFTIPASFYEAVSSLFAYFGYAQGILPIVADPTMSGLAGDIGLLDVLSTAILFTVAIFLFKLALFILHHIPVIGISRSESFNSLGKSTGTFTTSSTRGKIGVK
jgi:hypothetical protein